MAKTSFKSISYFPIKMKPWLRNPGYSFILLLQFRLFLKICKAVFLHWKMLFDKQNVYYGNSWRQSVESILQKHSENRAQRCVTIVVSKLFSSVLFHIFFVINTGKYLQNNDWYTVVTGHSYISVGSEIQARFTWSTKRKMKRYIYVDLWGSLTKKLSLWTHFYSFNFSDRHRFKTPIFN